MSNRIKGIIDAVSDLAMDYSSRMARAKDQGFDTSTPVYHGTASDFDAFDPDRAIGSQFWSTTDKAAIEAGDVGAQGNGVVKEMYHRISNPAGWNEYDKFGIDELIGQGYDGLKLPESGGQSTMVAFDPSQYRSVNAAFDPAKKDSANLLAGVTGAGLLGGSMFASEDADAGILSRIKAFHGSPHDFDRFSSDNIGTGEGAQAYGHGLYFAEREGTAQSYRDALTPRDFDYEEYLMEQYRLAESGQDYNRMDMLERAMQHDTPRDFRDIAADADYDDDYRQLAADMADEMEGFVSPSGNPVNFGRMYEVDIDARPEDLLDYDRPLGEQSRLIQDTFGFKPAPMPNFTASDVSKTASDNAAYRYAVEGFPAAETIEQALKQANAPVLQNTGVLGSEAYDRLARSLSDEKFDLTGAKSASEQLKNAGIKGIKYADAQTRFSPKGRTNNYVMFDDKTIEIARKYGVSMPVAGAILAGTMTPEQAQASTKPEGNGLLDSIGDTALETMSGVNRAVADGVNFLTSDQINAVLNLSGSEKRIPDLYDIPGVQSGTKGNYMEPGLLRQIVRQGSEFLSPI